MGVHRKRHVVFCCERVEVTFILGSSSGENVSSLRSECTLVQNLVGFLQKS